MTASKIDTLVLELGERPQHFLVFDKQTISRARYVHGHEELAAAIAFQAKRGQNDVSAQNAPLVGKIGQMAVESATLLLAASGKEISGKTVNLLANRIACWASAELLPGQSPLRSEMDRAMVAAVAGIISEKYPSSRPVKTLPVEYTARLDAAEIDLPYNTLEAVAKYITTGNAQWLARAGLPPEYQARRSGSMGR